MKLEDITEEQVEEFKKMCNRPNALDKDCKRMILAFNGDTIAAAKKIIAADLHRNKN